MSDSLQISLIIGAIVEPDKKDYPFSLQFGCLSGMVRLIPVHPFELL